VPDINEQELASQYGYAMSLFKSNPELEGLFNQAVAETWTPDKFQARLRATNWYKTTSETARNAQVLKSTDPKTYQANVSQVRARVGILATEYGANMTAAAMNKFAESAYQFGYDDNQIRKQLASYIKTQSGRLTGTAGQWEREWRQHAADMGLTYSASQYRSWARNVASGRSTVEDVKSRIGVTAASAYPHLKDRIQAGETLADIAEPYKQTMSQLLEVNPEAVTLKDPMLKKALAVKDKDGKPTMQTLYDFENTVRNDQRWLKTNNAQDEAMNVTRRVLTDMGVLGG